MGKGRPSIVNQAQQAIRGQIAYGQSKHRDKISGRGTEGRIYSKSSAKTYEREAANFARWARETHGCRDLEPAREYVQEYLNRAESGFTQNTQRSAICKMYRTTAEREGWTTKGTSRDDITRGRTLDTERSKHWNPEHHRDFVRTQEGGGFRPHEYKTLVPNDPRTVHGRDIVANRLEERQVYSPQLGREETRLFVRDVVGKNGLYRDVMIARGYEQHYRDLWERTAPGHTIPQPPTAANVHHMRGEYIGRLYHEHARDPRTLDRSEVYHPRGELGKMYPNGLDKAALQICSNSAGHQRLDVIVDNYSYAI